MCDPIKALSDAGSNIGNAIQGARDTVNNVITAIPGSKSDWTKAAEVAAIVAGGYYLLSSGAVVAADGATVAAAGTPEAAAAAATATPVAAGTTLTEAAAANAAGAYTGLGEASAFNGAGAGLGVGGTSATAGGGLAAALGSLRGTGGIGSFAGSLINAGASLYGANQASNAINNAANSANALSQQAMANEKPWMTAGQDALTAQQNLMGLGANGANGASGELTALQQSPGYQFGLSQGQRGLDASAAARGGMGSGKTATAASQWNQNYANTGYNNRLSQLSGLSQVGQNAASNVGTQLNMQGSNTANAGLASANATMQGTIGAGNALSSFLNPNYLTQSTLTKAA